MKIISSYVQYLEVYLTPKSSGTYNKRFFAERVRAFFEKLG